MSESLAEMVDSHNRALEDLQVRQEAEWFDLPYQKVGSQIVPRRPAPPPLMVAEVGGARVSIPATITDSGDCYPKAAKDFVKSVTPSAAELKRMRKALVSEAGKAAPAKAKRKVNVHHVPRKPGAPLSKIERERADDAEWTKRHVIVSAVSCEPKSAEKGALTAEVAFRLTKHELREIGGAVADAELERRAAKRQAKRANR